jgi:hypothetical protein
MHLSCLIQGCLLHQVHEAEGSELHWGGLLLGMHPSRDEVWEGNVMSGAVTYAVAALSPVTCPLRAGDIAPSIPQAGGSRNHYLPFPIEIPFGSGLWCYKIDEHSAFLSKGRQAPHRSSFSLLKCMHIWDRVCWMRYRSDFLSLLFSLVLTGRQAFFQQTAERQAHVL